MSIDIEILEEAYTILKQYIPTKDRQEAADNLISAMLDSLSDQDLDKLGSADALLSRAYKEYVVEEDGDESEDEE